MEAGVSIESFFDAMRAQRSPPPPGLTDLSSLRDLGVFRGLARRADGVWSTGADEPDWTPGRGDPAMLVADGIGYCYDASVPAVEIRTPYALIRHVGMGYGHDLRRAHRAALTSAATGHGRVVVVSRASGSAVGLLHSRSESVAEAVRWLREHPAGRWPLPGLGKRLQAARARDADEDGQP